LSRSLASIGLLAKTGKAIAIAIAGTIDSPRLLERRELILASSKNPKTFQPYHVVMDLPWAKAMVAVKPTIGAIERLAVAELENFTNHLATQGLRVSAVGIVGSIGGDPARIGNPHIRAHAAEGQLFRQVLEMAAARCNIANVSFSPQEIVDSTAQRLNLSAADLTSRVQALGKGIVRPWRQEERLAACAAWIALSSVSRQKRPVRSPATGMM
jgi:hypothetical protein